MTHQKKGSGLPWEQEPVRWDLIFEQYFEGRDTRDDLVPSFRERFFATSAEKLLELLEQKRITVRGFCRSAFVRLMLERPDVEEWFDVWAVRTMLDARSSFNPQVVSVMEEKLVDAALMHLPAGDVIAVLVHQNVTPKTRIRILREQPLLAQALRKMGVENSDACMSEE